MFFADFALLASLREIAVAVVSEFINRLSLRRIQLLPRATYSAAKHKINICL
jgi:hypothetical protein